MGSGMQARQNRVVKSSQSDFLRNARFEPRLRELKNSKRPVDREWRDRWKELYR